jgi:hypothetical protein
VKLIVGLLQLFTESYVLFLMLFFVVTIFHSAGCSIEVVRRRIGRTEIRHGFIQIPIAGCLLLLAIVFT